MKKKKKQGKKKFGRFFRRRFCLVLLAAVGILGRFYYRGWKNCTNLHPESYLDYALEYQDEDDTEKRIEKALKRTDEHDILIFPGISEMLACCSESGDMTDYCASERALMLYQPETGEVITSEPYAVAVVMQNEEKKYYFLHDRKALKLLSESQNKYEPYYPAKYHIHNVYSIYVKDDQFILGEVFFEDHSVRLPHAFRKAGRQRKGKWVDLSPADLTGWTKVCNDSSKESLWVYDEYADNQETADESELSREGKPYLANLESYESLDAPRADALMKLMRTEIPERNARIRESARNSIHEAIYGDYQTMFDLESLGAETREELVLKIRKNCDESCRELPMKLFEQFRMLSPYEDPCNVVLPGTDEPLYVAPANYEAGIDTVQFRGKEWELFHFQYVNPKIKYRRDYLSYLPLLILPALILSLAAALLWSVIAYLIYSRRYDLEAYRRNLTGALAHDLKTPLAVIYGNAENLRAHTHPEQADDYADRIMENVTHIDEMIAGVLGLAQLENGVMPERKETVDLTALLHTAFQRSADQMAQRGLTLTESGKMEIRGNTEMLTQLAENLAANAVQHAAEGGTITVTAEKKVLRICNPYTGELDEKAICEPFRRGDAARGMHSGSGLGLSIVQQIAALQKLRLRVTARDGVFTAELKRRR